VTQLETDRAPLLVQVTELTAASETGAGWVVQGSAEAMRKRGWDVVQIAGDDLVPRLPGRSYGPLAAALAARTRRRLRSLIGSPRPCVIECHGFSSGLVALALRLLPVPGTVTVFRGHGFWRAAVAVAGPKAARAPLPARLIYGEELGHGMLESLGVRSSDGVLVQSAFDERFALMVDGRDSTDVLCVSPGVDQRSSPSRTAAGPHLVWVGRQSVIKGSPIIDELVPKVLQDHPALRVTLVGVDPSTFAAHPRLAVHAHLDRDRLASVLASATWFLWASLYEGFGLAPMEAMARGVPVVGQRVGGLDGILDDEISGFVVTEPRVQAYRSALARALSVSPAAWKAMSSGAREAVHELTWAAYAERVIPFFRGLLERRFAQV
jgi:glycosyltransferase involved in cell wall biosynthesis